MPRRRKNARTETFKRFLSAQPLLRRFDSTMSQEQIAKRLGVHASAVSAWQRGGQIHWLTADSIAVRLGTHPAEVWGDDWTVVHSPELTETNPDLV